MVTQGADLVPRPRPQPDMGQASCSQSGSWLQMTLVKPHSLPSSRTDSTSSHTTFSKLQGLMVGPAVGRGWSQDSLWQSGRCHRMQLWAAGETCSCLRDLAGPPSTRIGSVSWPAWLCDLGRGQCPTCWSFLLWEASRRRLGDSAKKDGDLPLCPQHTLVHSSVAGSWEHTPGLQPAPRRGRQDLLGRVG